MNMSQFVIPQRCEIPAGALGVWQIPELDISIPVYRANSATAQGVIDEENSATLRQWGVGKIIEDHADSETGRGLWQIGEVKVDMLGFLITEKETRRYVCNRVMRAYRHNTCFTVDGIGVTTRSPTDILCVCCATKDASEVYLAAFKD